MKKTGTVEFGLIGLAVMGQNLALNAESRGYSVAVYNRTGEKTRHFMENRASDKNVTPAYDLQEFVKLLKRPRKIMLMVKAGPPVDKVIEQLLPCLETGDLIIDGGNSHFTDTRRRSRNLEEKGILFLGTGVSGGEEGALNGPSIMPGGNRKAYHMVENLFRDMSAKVDGIPCCTYIGPGDAGHYVKMVHNGIEYGDMQLIAETYDYLTRGLGLSREKTRDVFARWRKGPLASYLIDITTDILGATDQLTGRPLLEMILDKAEQKGTGKWTSQAALDIGSPVTVIDSAVFARYLSAQKDEREKAGQLLPGPSATFNGKIDEAVTEARDALLCSKITVYAQGMSMLKQASGEFGFDLKLDEIAQIWKGGCIIRADMLEPIRRAFEKNSHLENLYLDGYFRDLLSRLHPNWRARVMESIRLGIPSPATAAALAYYDGYRSVRLPANLIQAQRDYFGAHTYQRIDREGSFHTNWQKAFKLT